MSDPQNDPLFDEQKKSNRNSISPLNTSMISDITARKISEMSSVSSNIKDEISRTPSPKLSPRADQQSKLNSSVQKAIEEE